MGKGQDKDTLKLNFYSIGQQLFREGTFFLRQEKQSTQLEGVKRSGLEILFGARKPVFFKHARIALPVRGLLRNYYFCIILFFKNLFILFLIQSHRWLHTPKSSRAGTSWLDAVAKQMLAPSIRGPEFQSVIRHSTVSTHSIPFPELPMAAGLLDRDAHQPALFAGTRIKLGVFWLGGNRSRPPDMDSVKPAFMSCALTPFLHESQEPLP